MGAICRALGDMPAGPKKKRAKAPAKKAKNRSEGYNLQNRRPSGNYKKHRQVLPLDLIQAGEAEWFIEACGKTVSHGGARGTIAGSTTASLAGCSLTAPCGIPGAAEPAALCPAHVAWTTFRRSAAGPPYL